jgi:hypothetical protein
MTPELERWREVAADMHALLHQNELLMQRRTDLYLRRAVLFRDLVDTAKSFVDRIDERGDNKDQLTGTSASMGTVASPLRSR